MSRDRFRSTTAVWRYVLAARISDGLDVLVTAPLEAVLSVELRDLQNPSAGPVTTIVPLLDLISKPQKKDLDKLGNRVLIRRAG